MKIDALQYHLIMGALRLVAICPLRLLYVVSDVICFIVHRVLKYRVNVVRKNLRNSFPEKSEKELRKIENDFYHYFCDCIVETIKQLHISDRQVHRRIHLQNGELISEVVEQGKPFVLFLGHFGNWEWVQAITIMLKDLKVMGALYMPLRNKVMNRVVLKLRSRFRLRCIPAQRAYRTLVELRRETPAIGVGFIADQRPVGAQNIKHWTTFMGQPTAYHAGGETIGNKMGASYLYAEAQRVKRGHYNINIKKIEVDPQDSGEFPYTRAFYRLLEESIRRQPAFWLWSHNRWRAKPPQDYSSGDTSVS